MGTWIRHTFINEYPECGDAKCRKHGSYRGKEKGQTWGAEMGSDKLGEETEGRKEI